MKIWPIFSYLVDAFGIYAASTRDNISLRCVTGAVLPLSGVAMNSRKGRGWGNSVLVFIALLSFCQCCLCWCGLESAFAKAEHCKWLYEVINILRDRPARSRKRCFLDLDRPSRLWLQGRSTITLQSRSRRSLDASSSYALSVLQIS